MIVHSSKNPIILKESDRGIYKIAEIRKKQGLNKIVPGEEYKEENKYPKEMSAVSQAHVLDMKEKGKKNQATDALRRRVKAMSSNLNKGIEDINDLADKIRNK